MQNKQPGLSLVWMLLILAVFIFMPMTGFAPAARGAGGSITYNRVTPSVGLMNIQSWDNNTFRQTYLRKNNDQYNLVYKFQRTEASNVSGASSTLGYNTSMMHSKNGSYWRADYNWNFSAADAVVKELIQSGQITVDYSANLTADKHYNLYYHGKKKLDRAHTGFMGILAKGGYEGHISLDSDADAPDETAVYKTTTRKMIQEKLTGFKLIAYQSDCKCGSSKVANISVGLIDLTAPVVTKITASAAAGGTPEPYGFKAGETGYLNLEFSEPIRFANDAVPANEVTLNLVLKGAKSGTQINTTAVQAKLTELSGNRLSFVFTVPATINSERTNVYISGVSSSQPWISSAVDAYPLVLLGQGGQKITLSGSLAQMDELTKTSSLVTDIAGNPVNWSASTKTMVTPCYLDNVDPEAASINIKGARISTESHQTSQATSWPEDIDRSAVFSGAGDQLTFSARFSEEIKLPAGVSAASITAALNVKANGTPVVLTGASLQSVGNGVNGITVSELVFTPVTITASMQADDVQKPMVITEITFPAGSADLRRNTITVLSAIPAPAQQQYLDTEAPQTTTSASASGSSYAPVYYPDDTEKKAFFFPIRVADSDSHSAGSSYISGVNGVTGSFAWKNNTTEKSYPFEYYVSVLPDQPDDAQYREAATSGNSQLNFQPFEQVESGNYIHIRLKDGIEYNIAQSEMIVRPVDYATNTGNDPFVLAFVADLTAPTITGNGVQQAFDAATRKGKLAASVTVEDAGGIEPDGIAYQWVAPGNSPDEGDWQTYVTGATGIETACVVTLSQDNLAGGNVHAYDLYVKAIDQYGNETEPFLTSCVLDLTTPNPNLEVKGGLNGKPVQSIEIGMNLDGYSGDDPTMQGTEATTVVLVKNPEADSNNQYFVIAVSSRDSALAQTDDLFEALKVGYFQGTGISDARLDAYSTWYKANVTKEHDNCYRFANSAELTGDELLLLGSILDPQSIYAQNPSRYLAYYGNVEATFITAYGDIAGLQNVQDFSGGSAPFSFDFTEGRVGDESSFYLDGVDGVYVAGFGSYINEDDSFYYTGTYSASAVGVGQSLTLTAPLEEENQTPAGHEASGADPGNEAGGTEQNPNAGDDQTGSGEKDGAAASEETNGSTGDGQPGQDASGGAAGDEEGGAADADTGNDQSGNEGAGQQGNNDGDTSADPITMDTEGEDTSTYQEVSVILPFTRIEGNLNVQSFTLAQAYRSSELQADFGTGVTADGNRNLMWQDEYQPGTTAKYLQNLDGAQIPFTLSSKNMKSWGVEEIDFDSDDTYVALYYTEHGISASGSFASVNGHSLDFSDGGSYGSIDELTPLLASKPIKTGREQTFIIPNGLTDKTGFYALEVSLKPFNGTNVQRFYYRNMFVDSSAIQDYGATYYRYTLAVPAAQDSIWFDQDLPENAATFLIGTAPEPAGTTGERSLSMINGPEEYRPSLVYFDDALPAPYIAHLGSDSTTYIKIWNGASTANGAAPADSVWRAIYGSAEVQLQIVGADIIAAGSGYGGEDDSALYLPIQSGASNTICYQVWSLNGKMTPVKQFVIVAAAQGPQFEVGLDSSREDGWVPSITASAENVESGNGLYAFACFGITNKTDMDPIEITRKVTEMEGAPNGAGDSDNDLQQFIFYVIDGAGNVSFEEKTIDWIDCSLPELTVQVQGAADDNEFHVLVTVSDDHDLAGQKLLLSFDEVYSALLQGRTAGGSGESSGEGTATQGSVYTVEVPLNETGAGEWNASADHAGQGGVYKTKTILSADHQTKTVEIWGAFYYEDTGAASAERRLTFQASDVAGNLSEVYEKEWNYDSETEEWVEEVTGPLDGTYLDFTAANIKPAFSSDSVTTDDRVQLAFTAPVLVNSPAGAAQIFSREIDGAAIYSNGEYTLTYSDLFAQNYTETITVDAFDDAWNAGVKFSNLEPTQDDVTMGVEIPSGSTLKIVSLTGTVAGGSLTGTVGADGTTATLIMTDNGTVDLVLEKDNGNQKIKQYAVTNIDRAVAAVTPYLYYTGGEPAADETSTSGVVVAGLCCDEFLAGTNGPLTWTFPNGSKAGDQYTFAYEDLAKNAGSLTVTLPYDIVFDETVTDTTPPAYNLTLYMKKDYLTQQADSLMGDSSTDGQELTDALNHLGKAQGYLLSFNVFDDSKVKLIVKTSNAAAPAFGDSSDAIAGVTVADRSVVIADNAIFTIYLVDEAGNTTQLPAMDFTGVDITPPAATVQYEGKNLYKAIGYLIPSDSNEAIIVTNLAGVVQDDGSSYNGRYTGKYYHEYLDNENFVFYFKDEVGNTASTEGRVDWLDVSVPLVTSVKWTPAGAGETETEGIYLPPEALINKDVVAQVRFNKTVQAVKAYAKGTTTELDPARVEVSYVQNGAVLTYHENAEVDLYFKSFNGKEGVLSLGSVACIDKETFNVTQTDKDVSADKQSVTYTFETDKEVYLAEDEENAAGNLERKDSFTLTYTANGSYSLHFTDAAGNSVVRSLVVDELDKEIMTVLFNTAENETGAVADASRLTLADGDPFYVRLSKTGTVTFAGNTINAAAGAWTEFTFSRSGTQIFYPIEAKDSVRGTSVFSYIRVELPDTTAPALILASSAISVKEGSNGADILTRLNQGVTASDDRDGSCSVTIESVNAGTEEIPVLVTIGDDMTAGKYTVTYKTQDAAGNITRATRTLRIYGADSLNLLINGSGAEPEGTLVLKTETITLTVENLPGNGSAIEPCQVSYKAGIKTAGQMKIGAAKVATDSFTLPGTGFYTIYVQAQDRKDYITYVYIQK